MRIVIDTNILMTGLIKDSIIREILISNTIKFYLPDKAIEEIKKHKIELIKKSGYTEIEFDKLLTYLLEEIEGC